MELKVILWIIIGAAYVFFKYFPKKRQEEQRPPHLPPQSAPPPVPGKEKSLLETLMEEIEKQKELTRPQPEVKKPRTHEVKQKVQQVERKPKPLKKPQRYQPIEMGGVEGFSSLDKVEREEGISSIPERYKGSLLTEEPEEKRFEFNPREAFMMKTLLERPDF